MIRKAYDYVAGKYNGVIERIIENVGARVDENLARYHGIDKLIDKRPLSDSHLSEEAQKYLSRACRLEESRRRLNSLLLN